MATYGYHRTSTRDQHLDRGLHEIQIFCKEHDLELENIFTDQQTGKNFNETDINPPAELGRLADASGDKRSTRRKTPVV